MGVEGTQGSCRPCTLLQSHLRRRHLGGAVGTALSSIPRGGHSQASAHGSIKRETTKQRSPLALHLGDSAWSLSLPGSELACDQSWCSWPARGWEGLDHLSWQLFRCRVWGRGAVSM